MAVPSHETTAAVGVSPPSRVGCSWPAWSSPPLSPVSEEHKHLARGAPPSRIAAPGNHLPPPAEAMQSRTHLDDSRRFGSLALARGVDGGLAQACPRVTEHTEFSIPKRGERWVSIGLGRHCPSGCGKVWNRRRASRQATSRADMSTGPCRSRSDRSFLDPLLSSYPIPRPIPRRPPWKRGKLHQPQNTSESMLANRRHEHAAAWSILMIAAHSPGLFGELP